jgi:hypothetical protein
MDTLDGISAATLLALCCFAIDRTTGAALFVLTSLRPDFDPALATEPERRIAREKTVRWIYFCVASVMAVALIIWLPNARVLKSLNTTVKSPLDYLLTFAVLVGGSDQFASLLKTAGLGGGKLAEAEKAEPVQISGTLVLHQNEAHVVEETTAQARHAGTAA